MVASEDGLLPNAGIAVPGDTAQSGVLWPTDDKITGSQRLLSLKQRNFVKEQWKMRVYHS